MWVLDHVFCVSTEVSMAKSGIMETHPPSTKTKATWWIQATSGWHLEPLHDVASSNYTSWNMFMSLATTGAAPTGLVL